MISFVVPAHNEERLLGATLEAIHAAARTVGEPYEIVVADDGSSDRTALVAEEHGAVVVRVEHRQISATRNSGANAARGSLLVFVDADTQITSQSVAGAVDAVRHGAVGGGAPIQFDGVVPLYARLILPLLTLSFRLSRTAAGCFLFCTREAFDAVGGFDEAYFGAEEVVMSRAVRGREEIPRGVGTAANDDRFVGLPLRLFSLSRLGNPPRARRSRSFRRSRGISSRPLRTHGRFVVLAAPVVTSGRKLRAYSARELFTSMLRLAVGGRKAVQKREGLELWYAERRPDPRADA